MSKPISFQLSCRLDRIIFEVQILFFYTNTTEPPHAFKPNKWKFLQTFFVCGWWLHRLSLSEWMVCKLFRFSHSLFARICFFFLFLYRLPVIPCERSNKNSGFLVFSCPFVFFVRSQMFSNKWFYNSNCYFSTHTSSITLCVSIDG